MEISPFSYRKRRWFFLLMLCSNQHVTSLLQIKAESHLQVDTVTVLYSSIFQFHQCSCKTGSCLGFTLWSESKIINIQFTVIITLKRPLELGLRKSVLVSESQKPLEFLFIWSVIFFSWIIWKGHLIIILLIFLWNILAKTFIFYYWACSSNGMQKWFMAFETYA